MEGIKPEIHVTKLVDVIESKSKQNTMFSRMGNSMTKWRMSMRAGRSRKCKMVDIKLEVLVTTFWQVHTTSLT